MRKRHVIMARYDAFDERSYDNWTVANKIVTRPETKILKPSVIGSVVDELDGRISVRVITGVLLHTQRQAHMHCQASRNTVVEIHRQNIGANLASIPPVSQHVEVILDVDVLVADRNGSPTFAGYPRLSGCGIGFEQIQEAQY